MALSSLLPLLFLLVGATSADYPCQDLGGNFTWWPGPGGSSDGYCITFSDDFDMDADQADQYCRDMGVFAPSIHNIGDLDYWSSMAPSLGVGHFWLGTRCPHEQDPYAWTDGSRTNYFGPNRELLSCLDDQGFHIHVTGFVPFNRLYDPATNTIGYSSAPALCAAPFTFVPTTTAGPYEETTEASSASEAPPVGVKTTTTTTTMKPTTTTLRTTPKATTPFVPPLPDLNAAYCTCEPTSVYLDIVFVVDNSADMTTHSLSSAVASIQSVMYPLSFGTKMFQSQVGVVSFASDVQIVRNFSEFRSTADIWTFTIPHSMTKATMMTSAIITATGMISSNARDFTRGVIVLLSNSYNQLDEANIIEAAATFQDNGGVLISIDYSTNGQLAGLKRIASKGYYIDVNEQKEDLNANIIYAFCDANCFCSGGLTPFDTTTPRATPLGCYHVAASSSVFTAADDNCRVEKGFVATSHDTDKNFFLLSTVGDNNKFWLGYRRKNGVFAWEDNSKSTYTNWAPGHPLSNQDCVFAKKASGFNTQWFSAACQDPIGAAHEYACQLRPCDSTYNCWI